MRTAQQLPLDLRLSERARLASFVAAEGNTLVPILAQLAEGSAAAETQVYLHGPTATGKTHLLHAVCAAAHAAGRASVYLPVAEWVGRERPEVILDGMQQLPVLALDQIETVTASLDWAQALFSLINGVREQGGRLVVAGRTAPEALVCALPDLRSRLTWGPVFRLDPPDEPKLKAILTRHAAERGLQLNEPVATYLLRREARNLPRLLKLLDQLDLAALTEQRALTVPFVKAQLERRNPN